MRVDAHVAACQSTVRDLMLCELIEAACPTVPIGLDDCFNAAHGAAARDQTV
jgi:hypothetical protein